MPADTFIFDLDGTLVDSLHDIAAALNAALQEQHLPTAAPEQVKLWVGDGLRTLCRRACGTRVPSAFESLLSSAMAHYERRAVVETRPYPNILKMLSLLSDRGAPMSVLSNKPHDLTRQVISRLKLGQFFCEIEGLTDEAHRKPSPATALRIARRIGAHPADVMLVGDSVVDIQTARNAGMMAAAVAWGFRPEAELLAAGPDYLVHDPLEIVRLEKK
jgi:phosphoglycolate phosphatase